jgi:rhodanese-related sulfurtransferase
MPRKDPNEPYYRLTLDEAAEMYDQDDTIVIDVRREDEYLAGHVKGALAIPVDDVLARIDELPSDKKLLFICALGVRSGLGAEMAGAMGIDTEKLYNIEDGTPSWIEKGLPTSYGTDL